MTEEIIVNYPLREGKVSKWTREYKIEYDREYRRKIKEGLIKPIVRKTDSKWKDPEFRKAYDIARSKKRTEFKQEEKMKNPSKDRVNYHKDQKEAIFQQMIADIRNGKEPDHPHFKLTLVLKERRSRSKPSIQESS